MINIIFYTLFLIFLKLFFIFLKLNKLFIIFDISLFFDKLIFEYNILFLFLNL